MSDLNYRWYGWQPFKNGCQRNDHPDCQMLSSVKIAWYHNHDHDDNKLSADLQHVQYIDSMIHNRDNN